MIPIQIKKNELNGKWFVDCYNNPHEIIEAVIEANYNDNRFGRLSIVIRGEKTPWYDANSDTFVKWIGEKDDIIDYSKTLQNRQLVKNLFCTYNVMGEPIQC